MHDLDLTVEAWLVSPFIAIIFVGFLSGITYGYNLNSPAENACGNHIEQPSQ